jgi:hypothetical protein
MVDLHKYAATPFTTAAPRPNWRWGASAGGLALPDKTYRRGFTAGGLVKLERIWQTIPPCGHIGYTHIEAWPLTLGVPSMSLCCNSCIWVDVIDSRMMA